MQKKIQQNRSIKLFLGILQIMKHITVATGRRQIQKQYCAERFKGPSHSPHYTKMREPLQRPGIK